MNNDKNTLARPRDSNQLAKMIVDISTGQKSIEPKISTEAKIRTNANEKA